MKFTKKIAALLLSLVLLVSSAGCQYAILGCAAASCASSLPDSVKQQVADAVQSGPGPDSSR